MTTAAMSKQKTTYIAITACIVIGAATAAIFLSIPEIDLMMEHLFVDNTDRFFLARHPVPQFFNDLINNLAIVLSLFALLGLGLTLRKGRHFFDFFSRHYWFLTLSLIIGPGLIANALFKENWGRARPRQITEFGGASEFTPPLLMSDQCASNCSFVSGDASMGFALLAFALIAPRHHRFWVALAILFGAFIGLIRMIQGAHFLSDVIFAGVFVTLTILILKAWLLDRWTAPTIPRPSQWRVRYGFENPEEKTPEAQKTGVFTAKDSKPKGRLWRFFRASPEDLQNAHTDLSQAQVPPTPQ